MKIYLLFGDYTKDARSMFDDDIIVKPKLIKAYANEEKAKEEKLRLESIENALRKRRDECIFCPIHKLTKRKFNNPINKQAVISYCERGNFAPKFEGNHVWCDGLFRHIDKEYYINYLEVEE